MKVYIKPIVTIYNLEPLKLFACSEGYPYEENLELGYDESNEFWESITSD